MTINPSLTSEIQKLSPSAVIELFELDATSLGGELLRFHAGTNQLKQNIVWNGNTYQRYPVEAKGFEFNGQGQFPRPKLRVSNFMSAITSINLQYGDLLGAKVTRRRTMAKFLDAVNFPGGVNSTADPTAEYPEDVYFVDRKSNEDRNIVEYELASACDLQGVQIPRRQLIQNICTWVYRGEGCGYAGPPVFSEDDTVIPSTTSTVGNAVLAAYNAVVIAQNNLNVAQSQLQTATEAMDGACQYKAVEIRYNSTNYVYLNGTIISGGPLIGIWNNSVVTVGTTYKVGAFVEIESSTQHPKYQIERWGTDATCATMTTAYNAALANRDAKQALLDTANANYATVFGTLPPNDPIYRQERCGKRLASCKLRFGESAELPYGGFPSCGLIR